MKNHLKKKIQFDILTIFPDIFRSYLSESLMKRAQEQRLLRVRTLNIRDFSRDRHYKVDDRPFGGGPGMVLKIDPIYRALQSIKPKKNEQVRTVLFSTRGKKLDKTIAKRLARYDRIIFICGRYEGVDERVATHFADEEISIGDYVLSGGELPALVTIEAVSRYIPGFLGKYESLEDTKGFYPVYTRPEVFYPKKNNLKGFRVPKVLISGDHKKIEEWRKQK